MCLPLRAEWLGGPEDPAEEVDYLPQGQNGVFSPRIRAAPQHPAQRVCPAGSRRSKQHFLWRLRPGMVRETTLLLYLCWLLYIWSVGQPAWGLSSQRLVQYSAFMMYRHCYHSDRSNWAIEPYVMFTPWLFYTCTLFCQCYRRCCVGFKVLLYGLKHRPLW